MRALQLLSWPIKSISNLGIASIMLRFKEYERMKDKCKDMGLQHFEVSAKTGQNVK